MKFVFHLFQRDCLIRYLSLDTYQYIQENLGNSNLIEDDDFQKSFNTFFRVRRNDEWREKFYSYFQEVKKDKNISFDEILKNLYDLTGKVEASFASKMLATINPDMPIWDQYVLKSLHIEDTRILEKNPQVRLEKSKEIYRQIIKKEKELLANADVKTFIKEFRDCISNEYNLSDVKILDYYLWSCRENNGI